MLKNTFKLTIILFGILLINVNGNDVQSDKSEVSSSSSDTFDLNNNQESNSDEENNLISRLQRDSLGGNSNTKDKSGLRFQQTLALRTKPLIEIGSEKYNIGLAVVASSTARAYTTGDFNAFVNGGPRLRTHLNRFADIELGYDFLAPTGQSPFGFDQVIQGQQSVSANADFNFSSWFSLGGYSVYSLTRREFVAQQARMTIGPEDFKILLGYDPVFKRFNFGFTLLFDDKIKFNQFTYRERKVGKKRRF